MAAELLSAKGVHEGFLYKGRVSNPLFLYLRSLRPIPN